MQNQFILSIIGTLVTANIAAKSKLGLTGGKTINPALIKIIELHQNLK
jgi:hypothetical protein